MIAFGFGSGWASQFASYTLDGSFADAALLTALRLLILPYLVCRPGISAAKGRWGRRFVAFSLVASCMKLVVFDGESWPHPGVVSSFLGLEFPMIAVQWLTATQVVTVLDEIEKIRKEQEEAKEDDDDAQYKKKKLGKSHRFKVLLPYFWPSTPPYWCNRIAAIGCWVFVFGSKACNIMAPIFLAAATNELNGKKDHGFIVYNLCMYAGLFFTGNV